MKTRIVLFLLVCSTIALLSYFWIIQAKNNQVTAQSSGECGNTPPGYIGIRYGTPDSVPLVSQTQALETAKANASVSITGAQISSKYVLFSNDNLFYADVDDASSDSQKAFLYRNRPAWVISYCGLQIRSRGRPRDQQRLVNTELNVVVDAQTGQVLQEFTYR